MKMEGAPALSAARAGLYLRLSNEDGEGKVSESIQNQYLYLSDFCRRKGIPVLDVYRDDGFSGLHFDRPGLCRMLQDIRDGKIDTVLVKDLSRLGRDYLGTGRLLEEFRVQGVRFLAVTDRIDTGAQLEGNRFLEMRSILNDFYARDISRKVRSALEARRENGQFIGPHPPYGYRRDPSCPGRLAIAPEGYYVRWLCRAVLSGMGAEEAAQRLNACGVEPPGAYRGAPSWTGETVRRLLKNPVYTGELIQNRTRKEGYKSRRVVRLPQEEWIVTPRAHPALLSGWEQEAAISLLGAGGQKGVDMLRGLIFCADCGLPMYRLQQAQGRSYLVCSGWKRGKKKEKTCRSHSLRQEKLNEAIRRLVSIWQQLLGEPANVDTDSSGDSARREEEALWQGAREQMERQAEENRRIWELVEEDRRTGIIAPGEAEWLRQKLEEERQALSLRKTFFFRERQNGDSGPGEQTGAVYRLIRAIWVTQEPSGMIVHLRFSNPFGHLLLL